MTFDPESQKRDMGHPKGNPFTIGFDMSWFMRENGEYESVNVSDPENAMARRTCAPKDCGSNAWAAGR